MHLCIHTLGLCVYSYRNAHHKQTFASTMNLKESKGISAALCSKASQLNQGRAPASPPLVPAGFGDPTVAALTPTLEQRPGFSVGGLRSKGGLASYACNAALLQLSLFPQRGLQTHGKLHSPPSLPSSLIPLLAVEKPSFLESSRRLLPGGIPAEEVEPTRALALCLSLHPSVGSSASWKHLGYKYSPTHSLTSFLQRNPSARKSHPKKSHPSTRAVKGDQGRAGQAGRRARAQPRTRAGEATTNHPNQPPLPLRCHSCCHAAFVSFGKLWLAEAARRKLLKLLWYGENLINVSKRRKSSEKLPANLLSFNFLAITVSNIVLSQ